MAPVQTACAYCGVGCGVIVTPNDNGTVGIKGDPSHPANFGRLCTKGTALGETLGLGQRLLHPMIRGSRVSWSDAVSRVAEAFSSAIRGHGPDSVAFYVSGQLLTEDYYVANKLMKGYIGSANIDTNSRLCMASAVAGHRRAFGADIVPTSYTDLEEADLVVLVGTNLAWCHPVLFQRLLAAKAKRNVRLVVIDPRRTATADEADLHLAIRPGTDVILFNGLLASLHRRGAADPRFIFRNTAGLPEALAACEGLTEETVAKETGLDLAALRHFYDLFAKTPLTVTGFSMGVNQSSSGTDKVNAIINCHLLTGRIGKSGRGPFSITGQPNAMGGREVGGLANMLAAQMNIEDEGHRAIVQKFWNSPAIAAKPGLKAVELFERVREGRIKALWIMATNPAVSLPDSSCVAEALRSCEFVALSDVTAATETARFADVLLPAAAWGEKDGTVTNSERRISRQRAFLPLPGEARPDWRIICDVAKTMGFEGFGFASPAAIFREYAGLTASGNDGSRLLNLKDLASLDDDAYDAMQPWQWGGARPFADGKFSTHDGRARFVATPFRKPAAHSFILNTGRVRDQWHTMTRTGLVPRLFNHLAEPFAEMNPEDAKALGLAAATLAEISGEHGKSIVRVLVSERVQKGQLFQPMHWSRPYAAAAIANAATKALTDPLSGQPEFKLAPVTVKRFAAAWYGFGVSVVKPDLAFPYWSQNPVENGTAFECAGLEPLENWIEAAHCAMGLEMGDHSIFEDRTAGSFRLVAFNDGVFAGAFFISPRPVEISRNWIAGQLGAVPQSRLHLLGGRPVNAADEQGPAVCICMSVGHRKIAEAAGHGASLDMVCRTTGAGTMCGSCRPEIARIVDEARPKVVAAE